MSRSIPGYESYVYNIKDPIYYDTETCGFYGLAILIQFAVGDGEIILHNVFKTPAGETLELIDWMMNHEGGVVGFNLTFDQFHLCKLYTLLSLVDPLDYPEDIIPELAELEHHARDGVCCKPVKACDLMLVAKRSTYQSTMDRKDIKIKRIPTKIAYQLADELEKRIQLKDIYFARRKDQNAKKWHIDDIEDEDGNIDPNFKNVVLRFAPSAALKVLAADALGLDPDDVLLFSSAGVEKRYNPVEKGWAPYAKAVGSSNDWKGAWPDVINFHIRHWSYSKIGRLYATKDVALTRDLHRFFGSPKLGDHDSDLACMVASNRWKGFKVDTVKLKQMRTIAVEKSKSAPTARNYVRRYLEPVLSPEEKLIMKGSTKAILLEGLVKHSIDDCPKCEGEGGDCIHCEDGAIKSEAAKRAEEVINARKAGKEVELYDKILLAGRFHASFKVIGALSGRMSGADKLNPQGIKSTKEVRGCFQLAWDDLQLTGGDFESFEVVIAVSIYDDPKLEADLLTVIDCRDCVGQDCHICGGSGKIKQKIHGLFAQALFPEEDYQSIIATKGSEEDLYTKGKKGVFSQLYAGNEFTLQTRLGISEDVAIAAKDRWERKYSGIKKSQQRILNDFQSMRQPHGIGTKVIWEEPKDYVESLLGFKRYFTLENMICKALFELAEKPPKTWEGANIKVRRRDREQTALGATRSALFGAAFSLQAANVRAATNHEIQSTGAEITKRLQHNLWQIQPAGCHEFEIMLLNVHDEIMTPAKPKHLDTITKIVNDTVEGYRELIPLIEIDWSNDLETWADK
jgi:hypothetical protein